MFFEYLAPLDTSFLSKEIFCLRLCIKTIASKLAFLRIAPNIIVKLPPNWIPENKQQARYLLIRDSIFLVFEVPVEEQGYFQYIYYQPMIENLDPIKFVNVWSKGQFNLVKHCMIASFSIFLRLLGKKD